MKRLPAFAIATLVAAGCAVAQSPVEHHYADIPLRGVTALRTQVTPLNEANREETYKVYTHLMDFEGEEPITKGPGGKFTHHRGLFIGWNHTLVDDERYDTWHMSSSYQQFDSWVTAPLPEGKEAGHTLVVNWNKNDGETIIRETRAIYAAQPEDHLRIIDFSSLLESNAGDIPLKGDSHHAGMQIRMHNEVSEHEETTDYILPEGAEEIANDEVIGGWWACAAVDVADKRYWVLHMTPPDHPGGEPMYSIRRYARFGAFWEPTLMADEPMALHFRIVVSSEPMDRDACQALYDAYAASR